MPEPVTLPPPLAMESRIWPATPVFAIRVQPGVRFPRIAPVGVSTAGSNVTVRSAATRPATFDAFTGISTAAPWPPVASGSPSTVAVLT